MNNTLARDTRTGKIHDKDGHEHQDKATRQADILNKWNQTHKNLKE